MQAEIRREFERYVRTTEYLTLSRSTAFNSAFLEWIAGASGNISRQGQERAARRLEEARAEGQDPGEEAEVVEEEVP